MVVPHPLARLDLAWHQNLRRHHRRRPSRPASKTNGMRSYRVLAPSIGSAATSVISCSSSTSGRRTSATSRSSAGRRSFAPLTPSSTYSTALQPLLRGVPEQRAHFRRRILGIVDAAWTEVPLPMNFTLVDQDPALARGDVGHQAGALGTVQ